jgi:2-polyprenyl-6-methoxyphenol hydroxylase-like FAD-dependent oxidoreductase
MKVLDWLGIGDKVRSNGMTLEKVEITNQNLKAIRKSSNNFIKDAQGNAIISIHRAKLQSILHQKLPQDKVLLGKEYLSHSESGEGINIFFKDQEIKASLLLGADGIHSKVRKNIFPDSRIRYSGQSCWRGISDIELPDEFKSSCREAWGNEIRFGFSAISKDKVYWFAVIKSQEGQKDNRNNLRNQILNRYREFHPLVKAIIENTPEERIIRNDISDLKPIPLWHKGRICLLGDAAHATTPNMGQGGAQGVEDAYYMSNILSKVKDYPEAFKIFESERKKKVNNIVNSSWKLGKLIHNRVGQQVLKLAQKFTPEKMISRQMQEIYSKKSNFDYLQRN